MQPDYNYGYQQEYRPAPRNTRKKIVLIAVGLFLIVGIFVLLTVKPGTQPLSQAGEADFQKYAASKTSLVTSNNFGYLNGNDLYGYNGISFYKANVLDSSKLTILNTGLKLPKPTAIFWADSKGALINFGQSFATSRVDDLLKGKAPGSDNKAFYTWYLDFASGTLTIASGSPIKNNLAYYNPQANGFFYITDTSSARVQGKSLPLYFYSLASNRSQTITSDLGVSSVTSIAPCAGSYRLCFISNDTQGSTTKQVLYGITRDNKIAKVFASKGNIYPTNNPEYFLTTDSSNVTISNTSDLPTSMYSMSTSKEQAMDFKTVAGADVVVHFNSDKNFLILTNTRSDSSQGQTNSEIQTSNLTSGYVADNGKISTGKSADLVMADGSVYKDSILGDASYNNTGPLLGVTEGGNETLVSNTKQPVSLPPTVDQQTVSSLVSRCIKPIPSAVQQYSSDLKLYSVYFLYDASFNTSVTNFGNCISKTGSQALIGYNYYIGAMDPVNQRYVSD